MKEFVGLVSRLSIGASFADTLSSSICIFFSILHFRVLNPFIKREHSWQNALRKVRRMILYIDYEHIVN